MTPQELINLCSPAEGGPGNARPAKRLRSSSEPRSNSVSLNQDVIDLSADEGTSARRPCSRIESSKPQPSLPAESNPYPFFREAVEAKPRASGRHGLPAAHSRPSTCIASLTRNDSCLVESRLRPVGDSSSLARQSEAMMPSGRAASFSHPPPGLGRSLLSAQPRPRPELQPKGVECTGRRQSRLPFGSQLSRPAPGLSASGFRASNVESAMSDEFIACRLQEQEDELFARRHQQLMEQGPHMQANFEDLEDESQLEDLHEHLLERQSVLPRRSRNIRPHGSQRSNWGASLSALLPLSLSAPAYHRGPNWSPDHYSALHQAVLGMARSGLPPQLLFSDRDFTSEDYEWLCRLDETVESKKGASQREIDAIPVEVFTEATARSGDATCCICMENYMETNVLRTLACGHCFHKDCVDKWLRQKATCPICQRDCK